MKKYLKCVGLCLVAGSLVFTSCGDDAGDEESVDVVDTEDNEDPVVEDEVKVDHRLPTPSRFFEVIAKIGGEAREDLTNPISNRDRYNTTSSLALNFGVYFADMSYMMNYGETENTAKYFATLEDMANELSISAIFSEEIMSKLSESESSDSMYSIGDEVYHNAYTYLESEEKGDVLSMMLVGGWVESMYIVTHLVDGYSENNEIIEEIAQQKDVLESIFEHVAESSMDNEDLLVWLEKLDDLQGIYLASIQNDATSTTKSEDGKLIIGGGDKVVLDEAAFGTIVEKIEEMRSLIVDPQ